ncbi:MAG TPA: DMT family transporter [Candidatus Dormibacteraeota bacterium]|nr:DMT family transporter [Candidatus Dormibacteraeota bacterium]
MPAALTERPRLAALLGALCIAFAGIFVRYADVSPITATAYRCLYALPALALLTLREERELGPRSRRQTAVALLAGACFGIDLTAFHAGIGAVGAGLETVLANLQVVIVGLVAWVVLGERPSGRLAIAVPLALAGAVLISGVIGGGAYGADPALGVAYGLVAAVFYAAYLLILRSGIGDPRRVAGPILDATAASALTAFVLAATQGDPDLLPAWPSVAWLVLLALVAQVAGGQLILVSLPRLPAVLTSLILLAQPVVTVILGMILLRESPSVEQMAGVVLILSGLVLASGRRSRARPVRTAARAGDPPPYSASDPP